MIDQVRLVLLEGLRQRAAETTVSPGIIPPEIIPPEIIAATASWAIYGAAQQWVHMRDRVPAEQFVAVAVHLVHPILEAGIPAAESAGRALER